MSADGGTAPGGPPLLLHLPPGVGGEEMKSGGELMEERLEELVEEPVGGRQLPRYHPLPPLYYRGMDDWPEATELHCWGCGLSFDGTPMFVPTAMERRQVKGDARTVFVRLGVTCSANCAVAYIDTHRLPGDKAVQARENLLHLYYAMTGVRTVEIPPAPLFHELEHYGGTLSDSAFRARLRELDARNRALDYGSLDQPPEVLREFPTTWDLCASADKAADEAPPPGGARGKDSGARGKDSGARGKVSAPNGAGGTEKEAVAPSEEGAEPEEEPSEGAPGGIGDDDFEDLLDALVGDE